MAKLRAVRLSFWLLICLVLAASPAGAQQGAGRIQTVAGAVSLVRGAAATAVTRGNVELRLGDTVRTGPNGRARVVTNDGQRATLGPNSSVTLGRAGQPGAWQMQAGRAAIWITGKRRTEVATPGAVAAAEGTGFELVVAEDGTTTLTVAEGTVEYSNPQGRVTVQPNQQSVARPGEAPSRPIAVDASGVILFEATVENLPLPIEPPEFFEPDPGAAAPFRAVLTGLAEQRPDAAAPAVRVLAEGRAGSAEAALASGLLHLARGEAGAARPHLTRASELAAQSPAGPTYLGLALFREGQTAEAEAALRQAITREPRAHAAHAYLSSVLLARGNTAEAETHARKAAELRPDSGLTREALGTVLLFSGRPSEAAAELRRAQEANPLSPSAHLQLAKALAAGDDLEGALREASRAVALDPEDAAARSTLGVLFMANKDAGRAEREFRYALRLAPNMAAARTGLGSVALQRGRFAQALREQKAALELDAGSAPARNNLGAALTARGNLREAARVLEEAVQLQPEYAVAHANLAIAYVELNQYGQAVRAAERAVRLGDRSPFVHTTLARIYIRQHRYERALAELRRVESLDPLYALQYFYLSQLFLLQGRERDARRVLFQGITLDPAAMVEQRLFARTEASFAGGENGTLIGTAKTDGRLADGKLSYFFSGTHQREDGPRRNDDNRLNFGQGIIGFEPDARHNLVFYGSLLDERGGKEGPLPGSGAGLPTPLFRHDTNGSDWQLMDRWQFRPDSGLTLKAGYRRLSTLGEDPLETFLLRDFRNREGNLFGELRLDLYSGRRDALVAGLSLAESRRFFNGRFRLVPGPGLGRIAEERSPFLATGYVEWHHRLNDHTEFEIGPYFGTQSDDASFILPKFVGRHRLGDGSMLALLAYPTFQERNTDLRPVEAWARPFNTALLGLDDSGWIQNYEATWQKPFARSSLVTATGFYRRAHRLLVPIEDPQRSALAARAFFPRAELMGGEVAYEQWLTSRISGRIFGRYTDSNSLQGAGSLPIVPRWAAGARLDYLDPNGWRGFAILDYNASQRAIEFVGAPGRTQGDYFTLDLRVEKQLDIRRMLFLEVRDVLDRRPSYFAGFPSFGRTILGGVEIRF